MPGSTIGCNRTPFYTFSEQKTIEFFGYEVEATTDSALERESTSPRFLEFTVPTLLAEGVNMEEAPVGLVWTSRADIDWSWRRLRKKRTVRIIPAMARAATRADRPEAKAIVAPNPSPLEEEDPDDGSSLPAITALANKTYHKQKMKQLGSMHLCI